MNIFLPLCVLYFSERQKCLPLKNKGTSNLIFTFPPLHHDKGAIGICTLEINHLMRACKSKTNESERAADVGAGY